MKHPLADFYKLRKICLKVRQSPPKSLNLADIYQDVYKSSIVCQNPQFWRTLVKVRQSPLNFYDIEKEFKQLLVDYKSDYLKNL